jgi:hypothetical protein
MFARDNNRLRKASRASGGRADARAESVSISSSKNASVGMRITLCLPEIKSGHIRDAIRRRLGGKEYDLHG